MILSIFRRYFVIGRYLLGWMIVSSSISTQKTERVCWFSRKIICMICLLSKFINPLSFKFSILKGTSISWQWSCSHRYKFRNRRRSVHLYSCNHSSWFSNFWRYSWIFQIFSLKTVWWCFRLFYWIMKWRYSVKWWIPYIIIICKFCIWWNIFHVVWNMILNLILIFWFDDLSISKLFKTRSITKSWDWLFFSHGSRSKTWISLDSFDGRIEISWYICFINFGILFN